MCSFTRARATTWVFAALARDAGPHPELRVGAMAGSLIGSEILKIAADILRGRKVHPDVRLIIAPASKQILLDAMEAGYIRDLVEAGAVMVTPGCGPCVGTHNGVPSDGENVISTANRNFLGRMGNKNASIYLSSPATVILSAIEGKIRREERPGGEHQQHRHQQPRRQLVRAHRTRCRGGMLTSARSVSDSWKSMLRSGFHRS